MKRLFTLVALLFCLIPMQAQKTTFWHKVNHFLTKPAVVDSSRIYQPKPSLSLGVFSTLQQASFSSDVKFNIDLEEYGVYPGVSTYRLKENLCSKLGLELGYGNVSLGYGLEIGPKSAWRKSAFAFNIIGKSWGIRFNYYKITNPFTSGIVLGTPSDSLYIQDEYTPDIPAVLNSFNIDAYYVFNNKRFAYPAAYKIGLVQRRTAGSWMLTARYMQGRLYNSSEGSWDSYNVIDCFNSLQASIGGGYSVNFVLWHKDPVGPRDEKLRNITFNLTAMPVITLVNFLKTSSYVFDEDDNVCGEDISKIWCYPMPNFIGNAALSFTFGRIYFSTQFNYNWFYFSSNNAVDLNMDFNYLLDDISFKGSFHDWTLKLLLIYRF